MYMIACNFTFIVVLCFDFLRNFLGYSIEEGIVVNGESRFKGSVIFFCGFLVM